MVLVDTSVWVSHLRHRERGLESLLTDASVMTHDFIIGELACGHLKSRSEILSLLEALPSVPIVSHEEILLFIDHHSLDRQGLGLIDVHLLASAKLANIPLWTLDQRLNHAAAKLKLSNAG